MPNYLANWLAMERSGITARVQRTFMCCISFNSVFIISYYGQYRSFDSSVDLLLYTYPTPLPIAALVSDFKSG